MPVVDGARISVSRHSDSKMQKTVKGAQAQYIGKIVCGAGNEIDREASTTHSGMHGSSFKKNLMKTETEEIFRSPKPQQYQKHYSALAEELERSVEMKAHSGKSVNVSDMTVSDEDGYLTRNENVQFKQQECERANLYRCEVDNSESCSEGRR